MKWSFIICTFDRLVMVKGVLEPSDKICISVTNVDNIKCYWIQNFAWIYHIIINSIHVYITSVWRSLKKACSKAIFVFSETQDRNNERFRDTKNYYNAHVSKYFMIRTSTVVHGKPISLAIFLRKSIAASTIIMDTVSGVIYLISFCHFYSARKINDMGGGRGKYILAERTICL